MIRNPLLNSHRAVLFVGIDPGSSSGGLAHIDMDLNCNTLRFKDVTEKDLYQYISSLTEQFNCLVILEQVHAFPGQGVSSTFKFGVNYGMLKGFLMASNIAFRQVTPQRWQAYFNMKRKPQESQPMWKKRLKQRAQELYPDTKINTETADAVLIAEYCRNNW